MAKGMPTGQKPERKLPRFNHDFSASRAYTHKVGQIIPARVIHSIPNEHFEIEVSDFLQSLPMVSAPFIKGRREFSFYYVPYVQLWQNYGQYQAQRDDKFSSALKGRLFEPRISLRKLYALCAWNMFKCLQADSSFNVGYAQLDEAWSKKPIFRYRASNNYNFAYEFTDSITQIIGTDDFMRVVNGQEEVYQPVARDFIYDRFGITRWSNWCRKLDMLRYGNILPVLSPIYDELIALTPAVLDSMAEESTSEGQFDTKVQTLFVQALNKVNRFLESIPENYYVSPFAILGYNKCYYTFFRNSFYELDYYVGDFNIDHLDCDSLESSIMDLSMVSLQFLDIYQHQ